MFRLKKTRGIIDASPAVAFVWKNAENWPIEYVSKNVTALCGYSADELMSGKYTYSDLIHPADLERVKKEAAVNLPTKAEQNIITQLTYRLLTKYNETIWVKDNTTIHCNENGQIKRYQGIIIDVTHQMESERQLKKLVTAINEISEGIVVTDIDGNIEYVNNGFEKITQYSLDEVKGKNPRILKSGKTDPQIYETLWQTVLAGEIWSGNLTNRRKDGTHYVENMTIAPIKNENQRVVSFVAIKRDISEQIRLEGELRQAQKLESVGQLAGGIAHEINTPIQYIGDNFRFLDEGFNDIKILLKQYETLAQTVAERKDLQDQLKAIRGTEQAMDLAFMLDEIPEAIQQSLEGVATVTRIVKAMNEFSRTGAHLKVITDINQSIQTTITVTKNEWKYCADLQTDLDTALPNILCLPAELNQVLLNLITNSAQAISEDPNKKAGSKGLIQISTGTEEDQIVIAVKDSGPGIPETVQHRVFDPFFTTKEPGKGIGSGLTVAYNTIVEKLKGEIAFETGKDKGTTFIIKLPIELNSEEENEDQSPIC